MIKLRYVTEFKNYHPLLLENRPGTLISSISGGCAHNKIQYVKEIYYLKHGTIKGVKLLRCNDTQKQEQSCYKHTIYIF